jgi:hypothetical protein
MYGSCRYPALTALNLDPSASLSVPWIIESLLAGSSSPFPTPGGPLPRIRPLPRPGGLEDLRVFKFGIEYAAMFIPIIPLDV